MASDNTDALIGSISIVVVIAICGAFCLMPEGSTSKKTLDNIVEAIPAPILPTPTVEPTIAPASILGHPKTLENIFEVLKKTVVTPEQFNGLFSMAGIDGLPNPPDGWQYHKTKEGIGLKKAENLSKKVK